jgi:hypothetical protein
VKSLAIRYQVEVHARSNSIEADAGHGTQHALLVVRVTDETNVPVPGLPQGSFTVYAEDESTFEKVSVYNFYEVSVENPSIHLPGVYVLALDWSRGQRGSYIFAVAVSHISSPPGQVGTTIRGQGLVTMIKLQGPDGYH